MLLIVTLPGAVRAGQAAQALFAGAGAGPAVRARCRRLLRLIAVGAGILVVGYAIRLLLGGELPRPHVYWLSLLVTLPALFWLLRTPPKHADWRLAGLLLLDLWALAWPLATVRPEEEVYPRSEPIAAVLDEARARRQRVLDRDAPGTEAGTPLGGGAPLALIDGVEALRGYNTLDYRRYKEYLQFIAGSDEPLVPFVNELAGHPVIGNFSIRNKNKSLLDLLGVGYVLQPANLASLDSKWQLPGEGWQVVREDPAPVGYDFATGGLGQLPPYVVYENTQAMPRAFVVPEAELLPSRAKVPEALAATDFRQRVLLADWDGPSRPGGAAAAYREAEVMEYRSNRVTVRVGAGPAGYLVLADVWYPGWQCAVDGRPATLYRANYLFRAVELPEGEHTVVFSFEPQSYQRGRLISGAALAGVLALLLFGGLVIRLRRVRSS
jgi:hypothetical protein